MRDRIIYEYVIELKDSNDDIINLDFCDSYSEVLKNLPTNGNYDIALIRTVGNDNEDVKDKSYAYLVDGRLPAYFDDGNKVPQRFLKGEFNSGSGCN